MFGRIWLARKEIGPSTPVSLLHQASKRFSLATFVVWLPTATVPELDGIDSFE